MRSHEERLIENNFKAILTELPNGTQYRFTGSGRLVDKRDEDGATGQGGGADDPAPDARQTSEDAGRSQHRHMGRFLSPQVMVHQSPAEGVHAVAAAALAAPLARMQTATISHVRIENNVRH